MLFFEMKNEPSSGRLTFDDGAPAATEFFNLEKHFDANFEMFRRLHHRHEFGGGTGAGLTIVKKIIEEHKAKIQQEKEE